MSTETEIEIETKAIIKKASEAASLVLSQAMKAAAQGTFAVGGCIVKNSTGEVIYAMHNNVLKSLDTTKTPFTYDPTAHGERQLVYWYYANKDKLGLPEPKDLTIITSLDPCAMCAGTILASGFNVAVVAIDDFAGINYNESFEFLDLPSNLRDLARSKFGYYACGNKEVDPSMYVREYKGGGNVIFKDSVVNSQLLVGCGDIFKASVENVRAGSSDSGKDPSQLSDPALLSDDTPLRKAFHNIFLGAFKIKMPTPRISNTKLHDLLVRVKKSEKDAKNAVAFLDPFGNVVLCLADRFSESPVHTAFMNVTRAYAETRFALMNNENSRQQAEDNLTHPKYGTFVFLYAPNPNDATTIMTLGAYGSTMEGSVPQLFPSNFQFFHPPLVGSMEELTKVIMNLPPFYTQLTQISVMQTAITE